MHFSLGCAEGFLCHLRQARAVKRALAAVGVRAYLCEDQVRVGGDWKTEIAEMMASCSVMVVLATATYGAQGTSALLGTWEELQFGFSEQKQMCIVRMCDDFTEARTKVVLREKQAILWTDEAATLSKIVSDVQKKLSHMPAQAPAAKTTPQTGSHGYS